MNFNSQICTTMEQSERLIDLGLKYDTADMMLVRDFRYLLNEPYRVTIWIPHVITAHNNFQGFVEGITRNLKGIDSQYVREGYKPAWSLHRLIEMAELPQYWECISGNWYDEVIAHIQSMIYINEFNKEYLEE